MSDSGRFNTTDTRLMARAITLAREHAGRTRPNPCVGAVLYRDGQLLAEGAHRRAGGPHAEIDALRTASQPVAGATLYVTLEPCNHTGRTGPCTEAIIAARIARVVIAARDPNPTAAGGIERLRAAGIVVDDGLLAEEARFLNPAFHTFHSLRRPLVTLKWAMTLDGCTSAEGGDSKWITDEAARLRAHEMRAAHDAVIIGIETLLADNARLSPRGVTLPEGVPPPRRIVLDTRLRTPRDSEFVRETIGQATIITAEDAPDTAEAALLAAGAAVWRIPRDAHRRLSVDALMTRLHAAGLQSLMVEGGRQLAGTLLESRLVDRIASFVAFRVLGAGSANLGPLQRAHAPARIDQSLDLYAPDMSPAGDGFLVEGWLNTHLFDGRA